MNRSKRGAASSRSMHLNIKGEDEKDSGEKKQAFS
jgi:hypothetical protein